jgi:hypothetical protein
VHVVLTIWDALWRHIPLTGWVDRFWLSLQYNETA